MSGPARAAGSCRYRHARSGELLPDPACTPGAVDTAVTPATLGSTVCRRGGYTASVRPPEALSTAAKRKVMAAYGVPWGQARDYELDHLIELNAGGSSDLRNLWPEPNTLRTATASRYVHNDKDALEAWTFHALCAHKVTLPAVQTAVATDWTTALARLHLPLIPPGYRG